MLFKDNEEINSTNEEIVVKNLIEIAKIMDMDDNNLKAKLWNKSIQTPNRDECSYSAETNPRETEKRMCRCMYFCNKDNYAKCVECKYPYKYYIKNKNIVIENYEIPTTYKETSIGNVDLTFKYDNDLYAVEVKLFDSPETLPRMIAEILTYCCDEKFNNKYKLGIMMPDDEKNGQEQLAEYERNKDTKEIKSIEKKITFFKYTRTKTEKGYLFEIIKL